jgi:DNA modification methylase
LEILPTLASGSVDAVITDPPYGIGYQSNKDGKFNGVGIITIILL